MQSAPKPDACAYVEPPLQPLDVTQRATESDNSSAISLEWLLDQLIGAQDRAEDWS